MGNGHSTLSAQIPALLDDLKQAQRTLVRMAAIEPELYERVRRRFEDQIEQRRQEVSELGARVRSELSEREAWLALDKARKDCHSLFAESLAYAQGALARQNDLDRGLCRLADGLLDEICDRGDVQWRRITILAESDFFGNTAQIIRLTFPEAGIWNLPLAVHELGHYIGPRIEAERQESRIRGSTRPFQDLLDVEQERKDNRAWSYLHEQFSDVFATYTIGPAYGFTCIRTRFNPAFAYVDDYEHPAAAKRVYLILGTLERMNRAAGLASPYTNIIDVLRRTWNDLVTGAAEPGELEPAAVAALDQRLEALYTMLDRYMRLMRYDGFARVHDLATELLPSASLPSVSGKTGIADVLNAAWLCRIQSDDSSILPAVTERALQACNDIVARPMVGAMRTHDG